jgi:hypothetical protein
MRRLLHRMFAHLDSHTPPLVAIHFGFADLGQRALCLRLVLAEDYWYDSTVIQNTNPSSLPASRAHTLAELARSGGLQLSAADLLHRILADGRKQEHASKIGGTSIDSRVPSRIIDVFGSWL